MKTTLTEYVGFSPFTFTVTVETLEEAQMLRSLFVESSALAETLISKTACGEIEANDLFEALGHYAQYTLSR